MIDLEDLKRYEERPEKTVTFYKGIPGRFDFQNLYREAVVQLRDGDHVVEVGSLFGASIAFFVDACTEANKKVKIDAIDLWDPAWPSTQIPILFELCEQAEGFFAAFEFFMKRHGAWQNVNVCRKDSVEALNQYRDGSLGFVFLDGNHSYEHVMLELSVASTKIRSGGVLAGHDYYPEFPPLRPSVNGVAKAVNDFFGCEPRLFLGELGVRSWWVTL